MSLTSLLVNLIDYISTDCLPGEVVLFRGVDHFSKVGQLNIGAKGSEVFIRPSKILNEELNNQISACFSFNSYMRTNLLQNGPPVKNHVGTHEFIGKKILEVVELSKCLDKIRIA
jgi:hypothetical protein